jgi:3-deoxy-D-manno-octulosonic-acid transferase
MQTKADYDRIIAIGADPHKVLITGSQKFDQETISLTSEDKFNLRSSLNIHEHYRIFIA